MSATSTPLADGAADVCGALRTLREAIVGLRSLDAAAAALGYAPHSATAERLRIYRSAYVINATENAEHLFPVTGRVAVHAIGADAWAALLRRTATEHPLPEIRFGMAGLVDVLAQEATVGVGLPVWLSELADLELTERQVFCREDAESTAAQRSDALGVTPTLVLRATTHDVFTVRNASTPEAITPDARTTLLAIWRGKDGMRFTRPLGALALRVLRAVRANGADGLTRMLAASGNDRARVAEIAHFLARLGILVGPLPGGVDGGVDVGADGASCGDGCAHGH